MNDRWFIATRINELQNEKNISSRKMSTDLGFNEGYINHIISGRKTPSLEALYKIVDYFGMSMSEFFRHEEKESGLMVILQRNANKLSEKDMNLLIELSASMLKYTKQD